MAVLIQERSPSLAQRLRYLSVVGLVGLAIAGIALLGFRRFAQSREAIPPLEPLPQDPYIQAYFNHSEASLYTEPYRSQERLGDDLEQVVVNAIQSAQVSVDVAVQELRLPGIARALEERHRAGVRVRVIVENDYRQPLSALASQLASMEARDRDRYTDALHIIDQNRDGQLSPREIAQNDALVILEQAGIPILDDRGDGSQGSGLMHHKFVVVDGRIVVMGSANFTPSDMHGDFLATETRGNANHLLRIENPDLARLFQQEFAVMWGDGVGGFTNSEFGLQKPYRTPQTITVAPGSTITVQFSPTSPTQNWWTSGNGLIGHTLNAAQQRVDLALFVFSDQNLSYVLEARHQKGVSVRALIDAGFIFRNYSEGLDMMGVTLLDNRCRIEAGNRPWQRAIATVGIPTFPQGDMLHHKFAVIDGTTVITGSQNWSAAANHQNDENVLVIRNATVAAHFDREFDRLYRNATLGVPIHLQEKIQHQQNHCNP